MDIEIAEMLTNAKMKGTIKIIDRSLNQSKVEEESNLKMPPSGQTLKRLGHESAATEKIDMFLHNTNMPISKCFT